MALSHGSFALLRMTAGGNVMVERDLVGPLAKIAEPDSEVILASGRQGRAAARPCRLLR